MVEKPKGSPTGFTHLLPRPDSAMQSTETIKTKAQSTFNLFDNIMDGIQRYREQRQRQREQCSRPQTATSDVDGD